jgi:ribosomal protein S24E
MPGADFLAQYLCTERMENRDPSPMQPLIRYLQSEKPVTRELRDWLVSLLKKDNGKVYYLECRRRKGAPRATGKDFIYARARELEIEVITRHLVAELRKTTGWEIAPDNDRRPSVYRLGDEENDIYGHSYIKPSVTLRIGKLLTRRQIINVIAAETRWNIGKENWASLSTVQRRLKGWRQ